MYKETAESLPSIHPFSPKLPGHSDTEEAFRCKNDDANMRWAPLLFLIPFPPRFFPHTHSSRSSPSQPAIYTPSPSWSSFLTSLVHQISTGTLNLMQCESENCLVLAGTSSQPHITPNCNFQLLSILFCTFISKLECFTNWSLCGVTRDHG